jgi:putative YhbY family RNA-binding protein
LTLSSRQRRELSARGHQLDVTLTVSADKDGVTESVVEHVRKHFNKRELIKVRIRTDDRAACEAAVATLAAWVPCEAVTRIGRVVLLYRPPTDDRQE